MTDFRLILSPKQDGLSNMASDQAIMEAVGEGHVLPTLRLYAWQPACLSLGYAQRACEVDFERLGGLGWDVVRRPTGGRAILHTDELTYSISLPQGHPLVAGDIVTSYRRLSDGLLAGLAHLGFEAQTAPYQRGAESSAVCFENPSAYEIIADGRKLIGSAQVRRQKAVLQHGSLPLYGDIGRICDALIYPDETEREAAKQKVRQRAATLEDVFGMALPWERVAEALITGMAETFGLNFYEESLTPAESLRLEQLRYDTYSQDTWTLKR